MHAPLLSARRQVSGALLAVSALAGCGGSSIPAGPPALSLEAGTLVFTQSSGEAAPPARSLSASNSGGGTLSPPTTAITYLSGSGWLSTTVAGSRAPFTLSVSASGAALSTGTWRASVEVSAAGASGSPQTIAVTLFVTRPVTLSAISTFLDEDAVTKHDVPAVLATPSIVLDDGSPLALSPGSPGSWSAQVPGGPYWLHTGTTWYRATGDHIDLGYLQGGRADAVAPTNSTRVTLALGGVGDWRPTDLLQLYSWQAASWDVFDPRLSGGATSGTAMEDWNAPAFGHGALHLLAAGDLLYVLQSSVFYFNAAGSFRAVVGWTSVSGRSMADGQPSTLSLPPMTFTRQNAYLGVDWRTTQFAAALQPLQASVAHRLIVDARPMAAGGELPEGATPNLLDLLRTGVVPDQTGDAYYQNFLPAQYKQVLHAEYGGAVFRTAPGAARPAALAVYSTRLDTVDAAPYPIVPLLSAVRTVTVGGLDATVRQTGLGLTPLVSWTAPAVGTPSGYRIVLYQLSVQAGSTDTVAVERGTLAISGTETSVQVPPGVLAANGAYAAYIVALAGTGGEAAPLRQKLPVGSAGYCTEVFSP